MSRPHSNQIASGQIQSLLAGLRRRIRAYIWIEGLSLALVWLGLTFWIAYAVDYWLLVRVFAVEFPWLLRGILLFTISVGLFYVLYHWILRRAFARLEDQSMAVVLERRFGQFQDGLVTSVEMSEHPDHAVDFNQQMLARAARDAEAQVPHIRLRDVFNFLPLGLSTLAAVLLLISIGSFAWATDAFPLAFRRTYLLANEQWPRNAEIEIVGISVSRPESAIGHEQLPDLLTLDAGPVKVAKGSDISLRVQANASKVIPDRCVVRYWAEDGVTGTVEMEKVGEPKLGFQNYRVTKQPFKSVLTSFRFEVIGKNYGSLTARDGDQPPGVSLGLWPVSNRVEGDVEVVNSPIVAEATVVYTRPKYIEPSGVPTHVTYGRGLEIPRGSGITIRCRSNNPLKFAHVYNPDTEVVETLEISGDPRQFEFRPPRLDQDLRLEISLHDQEDIVSESPHRMIIAALNDEPPKINVYLRGIGTAVTPDVVIPFRGTIRDDYGVGLLQAAMFVPLGPRLDLLPIVFEAGWLDVQATGSDPRQYAFNLRNAEQVKTDLDFRAMRNDPVSGFMLEPGKDSKLFIDVRAQDRLDLAGSANVGHGDTYQLDIVTADQLLTMLERLEAGQRERLQQIRNEMGEAHDFLLRVRAFYDTTDLEPAEGLTAGREPGDEQLDRQQQHSVRFSYAVKALLQTRKSSQEVAGVVDTIHDLREQLINNRIDAEDHKRRLLYEVVSPLRVLIANPAEEESPEPGTFAATDAQLVELERRLKVMAKDLDDLQLGIEADQAATASIVEIEKLLSAMDQVLQKLRKIEDYNRLLSYVRELLEDQRELNARTRQQYKKSALQDLLD